MTESIDAARYASRSIPVLDGRDARRLAPPARRARRLLPPRGAAEHASIDADELDAHVTEQILRRLEAEPGIIARAIAALDETQELDGDVTLDLEELEADPDVLRDVLRVSRQTWDELDVGAHRLLVIYLIDRVAIDYLALRSRNR